MTADPTEGLAARMVELIVEAHPERHRPGLVFCLIVRELDCPSDEHVQLSLDASVACGQALTETGALLLAEYAHRLRLAVTQISRDMTEEAVEWAANESARRPSA